MGYVELIGRQANSREVIMRCDADSYPRSVDGWIAEADIRGLIFDETVTRKEGVTLGQFSFGGGFVKSGDTLESYVEAEGIIDKISSVNRMFDINQLSLILTGVKSELGIKDCSHFRKVMSANEVEISGPYGSRKEILMQSFELSAPTEILEATDWDKISTPVDIIIVKLPNKTWWRVDLS